MTKKPEDTTTDVVIDEIDDLEVGGFTPEEEAALDAAAKGETTAAAVVDKKDDTAAATPSPEDELKRLRKELDDANATIKQRDDDRRAEEAKLVDKVTSAEAAEANQIRLADEKAAADLALAQRDVSDLTRALREAKENGDLDKEMEITDKLFDAKIKAKGIKDAKDGFDKWKDGRKDHWEAERKKAEKRVGKSDEIPFDESQFSPKALGWINQHPEFKTDKTFNAKAIRAHHAAVGEGLAEDSDEYFKFIDKKLGLATDDDAEAAASEAAAQAEAAVTVQPTAKKVAPKQTQLPPARTGNGQVRTESNRVKKLSPAEVEAAEISGMTPEEYWDDKYGNK